MHTRETSYTPSFRRHLGRAFSLIELLVVIAIVATLASLILAVTNSAKSNAKQVREMSNLRQIGAAVLLFAGENQGATPVAGGTIRFGEVDPITELPAWTEQIEKYLDEGRKIFSTSPHPHPETGEYRVDYFIGSRAAYLDALEHELEMAFHPVFLTRLASASRYVLVGKVEVQVFEIYDADCDNYSIDPAFGGAASGSKQVPLFFADGHVKTLTGYDPRWITTTYEGTETSFHE